MDTKDTELFRVFFVSLVSFVVIATNNLEKL